MILKHIVKPEEEGKQVLHILKGPLELSTRLITKLKKHDNAILLNSQPVFTNKIISSGDIVSINLEYEEKSEGVIPEEIPLDIIYEDELFIALNKPAETVIHPTHNYTKGTLANGLAHYFVQTNQHHLIRPVSRLDKDTSGVVIFAKNSYFQNYFSKGKNALQKRYLALVSGVFQPLEGEITFPIKRVEGSTIERTIADDGRHSLTLYKVLKTYSFEKYPFNASLVEFELMTGRTHQIRVHSMYTGHPLIGETLYNKDLQGNILDLSLDGLINRQCLHSYSVSFTHPTSEKNINLTAKLPKDIMDVIDYFTNQ